MLFLHLFYNLVSIFLAVFRVNNVLKKVFFFSRSNSVCNWLWTCIPWKQILNYFGVSGRIFVLFWSWYSHTQNENTRILTGPCLHSFQSSIRSPQLIFSMPSAWLRGFKLYLIITRKLKNPYLQHWPITSYVFQ